MKDSMHYGHVRPALLIAGHRTGGTYLAIALSNHPNIHCLRGELGHRRSTWMIIPEVTQRLRLAWSQQGYSISMCKLMYRGAVQFWDFISTYEPAVRIILLERLDPLAQAISIAINRLRSSSHPTHTFKKTDPTPVVLNPSLVADLVLQNQNQAAETKQLIKESNLPALYLTYAEITGGMDAMWIPTDVAKEICTFLGVPVLPLRPLTRKIHAIPYEKYVTNWDEVLKEVERCSRNPLF